MSVRQAGTPDRYERVKEIVLTKNCVLRGQWMEGAMTEDMVKHENRHIRQAVPTPGYPSLLKISVTIVRKLVAGVK